MTELNSIGFEYPGVSVFRDFSISFKKGRITCILGPSGSGKTTLLSVLASGGKANGNAPLGFPVGGLLTGSRSGIADSVSYVFQEPRLIRQKTVLYNVEFALRATVKDKHVRTIRAKEYLKAVGLGGEIDKYPDELSGGMAQRVALARAFSVGSELLLMDEPYIGLDIRLKKTVLAEFSKLYETDRRTVVYITHDIDDALMIADDIYVFEDLAPVTKSERFELNIPAANRLPNDPEIISIRNKIYNML